MARRGDVSNPIRAAASDGLAMIGVCRRFCDRYAAEITTPAPKLVLGEQLCSRKSSLRLLSSSFVVSTMNSTGFGILLHPLLATGVVRCPVFIYARYTLESDSFLVLFIAAGLTGSHLLTVSVVIAARLSAFFLDCARILSVHLTLRSNRSIGGQACGDATSASHSSFYHKSQKVKVRYR